jgi:hypothetical protein
MWYVLRDEDFSSQRVVEIRAQTKIGLGPVGQATSGRCSNPDLSPTLSATFAHLPNY